MSQPSFIFPIFIYVWPMVYLTYQEQKLEHSIHSMHTYSTDCLRTSTDPQKDFMAPIHETYTCNSTDAWRWRS